MSNNSFFCHFCNLCLGRACIGEMPGMGGVNESQNFILNCSGWDKIPLNEDIPVSEENLGIAPVTGAVQNIGFKREEDFYFPYLSAAYEAGISLCIGDGFPDEKLKLGLLAAQKLNTKVSSILKPYPQKKLFERIDWVKDSSSSIGVDIDAYNIISMRNQAELTKKTASDLKALRNYSKLPLVVKGVFTAEDVELCKKLKPEIIIVSNHGGRVQTNTGSTAEFLKTYADVLKSSCLELWVDGGIRKRRDIQVALSLGAVKCLAARPFINALCKNIAEGKDGVKGMVFEIKRILKKNAKIE